MRRGLDRSGLLLSNGSNPKLLHGDRRFAAEKKKGWGIKWR